MQSTKYEVPYLRRMMHLCDKGWNAANNLEHQATMAYYIGRADDAFPDIQKAKWLKEGHANIEEILYTEYDISGMAAYDEENYHD